ncbi:hypothetical protein LDFHOB_11735 [Candidatus Electronema aureum]
MRPALPSVNGGRRPVDHGAAKKVSGVGAVLLARKRSEIFQRDAQAAGAVQVDCLHEAECQEADAGEEGGIT